jgi:Predicted DNA-binding protein with PD1-like DNA-binding motif
MISDMERNNIIAKIEKDEPVLESIQSLIEDYGIYSGIIVFGIGMLKELEIGYWNGKEYEKKVIKEAGELVSFHGSITSNEPYVHAMLQLQQWITQLKEVIFSMQLQTH